jgi:hypothetical protein
MQGDRVWVEEDRSKAWDDGECHTHLGSFGLAQPSVEEPAREQKNDF